MLSSLGSRAGLFTVIRHPSVRFEGVSWALIALTATRTCAAELSTILCASALQALARAVGEGVFAVRRAGGLAPALATYAAFRVHHDGPANLRRAEDVASGRSRASSLAADHGALACCLRVAVVETRTPDHALPVARAASCAAEHLSIEILRAVCKSGGRIQGQKRRGQSRDSNKLTLSHGDHRSYSQIEWQIYPDVLNSAGHAINRA